MRTLLAFVAVALAAHCACAAPMSIARYDYQPSPPPFDGPRPPPPFDGPRPPPDDDHHHSDDLECMLSSILDKAINVFSKWFGLDGGNGRFDFEHFWKGLSTVFSESFSSSGPWTSTPSPDFWGNMNNKTVDPWNPIPMPDPFTSGGPDVVSSPSMSGSSSPPFKSISGMGSSGMASVMGLPSNNWGGPRPSYSSMEIKNSVSTSDMNGRPVMTVMGGGMPVMANMVSGRPPVMAVKPQVGAVQPAKPGKPAVAVAQAVKPPVAAPPKSGVVTPKPVPTQKPVGAMQGGPVVKPPVKTGAPVKPIG